MIIQTWVRVISPCIQGLARNVPCNRKAPSLSSPAIEEIFLFLPGLAKIWQADVFIWPTVSYYYYSRDEAVEHLLCKNKRVITERTTFIRLARNWYQESVNEFAHEKNNKTKPSQSLTLMLSRQASEKDIRLSLL